MTDIKVTNPVPLNANITVVNPVPLNQQVLATQPVPVVIVTGNSSQILVQSTPASSWSFSNPLSKLCLVDVYLGDEQVEADVTVTPLSISVVFASPQTGFLVIH